MSSPQLVVGGAGFIGSALVRALLDRGPVRVLDDLSTGRLENLAGTDVELQVGSILDQAVMTGALHDVSIVYDLACLGVRHSIHSPVPNHEVNATGTLRLLEACRAAGIDRFVYTSTSEVYGTALEVPMTEDHPTRPHTVYGAAKLAGEAYTRAFHVTYGLPTVVIRPFNSYGPRSHHEGDSGEVIPKFLVRAMNGLPPIIFGDGTQTRDFTYVDDTARGIAAAGVEDAAIGRTINLGSGLEIAIGDLASLILSVTGHHDVAPIVADARPGDVKRLVADPTVAAQVLHWQPSTALADGIEAMLACHRTVGTDWASALVDDVERNWERGRR